jgi:hypothetical protein
MKDLRDDIRAYADFLEGMVEPPSGELIRQGATFREAPEPSGIGGPSIRLLKAASGVAAGVLVVVMAIVLFKPTGVEDREPSTSPTPAVPSAPGEPLEWSSLGQSGSFAFESAAVTDGWIGDGRGVIAVGGDRLLRTVDGVAWEDTGIDPAELEGFSDLRPPLGDGLFGVRTGEALVPDVFDGRLQIGGYAVAAGGSKDGTEAIVLVDPTPDARADHPVEEWVWTDGTGWVGGPTGIEIFEPWGDLVYGFDGRAYYVHGQDVWIRDGGSWRFVATLPDPELADGSEAPLMAFADGVAYWADDRFFVIEGTDVREVEAPMDSLGGGMPRVAAGAGGLAVLTRSTIAWSPDGETWEVADIEPGLGATIGRMDGPGSLTMTEGVLLVHPRWWQESLFGAEPIEVWRVEVGVEASAVDPISDDVVEVWDVREFDGIGAWPLDDESGGVIVPWEGLPIVGEGLVSSGLGIGELEAFDQVGADYEDLVEWAGGDLLGVQRVAAWEGLVAGVRDDGAGGEVEVVVLVDGATLRRSSVEGAVRSLGVGPSGVVLALEDGGLFSGDGSTWAEIDGFPEGVTDVVGFRRGFVAVDATGGAWWSERGTDWSLAGTVTTEVMPDDCCPGTQRLQRFNGGAAWVSGSQLFLIQPNEVEAFEISVPGGPQRAFAAGPRGFVLVVGDDIYVSEGGPTFTQSGLPLAPDTRAHVVVTDDTVSITFDSSGSGLVVMTANLDDLLNG